MKNDLEIQKAVMAELKWDPFLNASEIGVAVKDGVVTLSGTVDSYLKKQKAEKAAKNVAGVIAVAEDIEVKLFPSITQNDTEIARRIVESLKWNTAVQEEKIKVKVENGWVTLEGEVEWAYQKKSAKTAVENLMGVKGISDLITVKKVPMTSDIERKIADAFHRSATIDANKIDIRIRDHKVILSGTVRSWAEQEDAELAAWRALGVTSVQNNLKVQSLVEVFEY